MTVQVNFSTPDSQRCRSTKYGCELIKTGVILLTSESFVKLEVKQVGPRFALNRLNFLFAVPVCGSNSIFRGIPHAPVLVMLR